MAHRNRWFTELKNGDFPWQTVSHNQMVCLLSIAKVITCQPIAIQGASQPPVKHHHTDVWTCPGGVYPLAES